MAADEPRRHPATEPDTGIPPREMEMPLVTTAPFQAPDTLTPPLVRASEKLIARIRRSVQYMHVAWGAAWLVGFGLIFLNKSPSGKAIVSMPGWLPLTVLFVMLFAAGVYTAFFGFRVFGGEGADPESRRRGTWYGLAWLLGFLALILTIGTATKGLTSDQSGLIWGASATGLTAVLHLAGSAIWLDRAQQRLGIWIIVVNIAAAASGATWQPLILAIGGGAVMVALGVIGLTTRSDTAA